MSNLLWVLVILLVVFSVLGAPNFGVLNHSYGYGPSGLGLVLIIVLLVVLLR